MLLIDASAPEDRQSAIVAEVQGMLEKGGSIVGHHDWGSRRTTFEIDHRPEASYHLFQFEGENALLDRLNHSLKITDGVLRFRIIRQDSSSPPVPPKPEPMRPRRDEEPDGRVAARAAADAAPDEPEVTGDTPAEQAEPAAPEQVEPVADAGAEAPEPAETTAE